VAGECERRGGRQDVDEDYDIGIPCNSVRAGAAPVEAHLVVGLIMR
jgi:hypothetical protein